MFVLSVSCSSLRSHVVCLVASVAAMYSASVVDRDTTFCFRELHEIGVVL